MSSVRFAPIASACVFGRRSESETSTANRRLPVAAGAVALVAAVFLGVASNGNASPYAGKWCSGQKIVFFPGGPAGGVFAVNVYNGAKQAAADIGANVQYVWSNWDPETMVSQFKSAIATNPAGIAVMGHPGDAALKPWVTRAESKGIIVTSQNTELPTLFHAVSGEGLRVRRPEPLRLGRPARRVGRLPAAPEEGRPRDGLGAPLPADPWPAHEGSDRRPEEGRPQGRLHRDQQADERRPGRRHPDLHCLRQLAS